jgi:hypothetical protein
MTTKQVLETLGVKVIVFNSIMKINQEIALKRLKRIVRNSTPFEKTTNDNEIKILFNLVRGMYSMPIYIEGGIAKALQFRGHDVKMLVCGGGLSMCTCSFTVQHPPNDWACKNCNDFFKRFFDIVDLPYLTYKTYTDKEKISNIKDKIRLMSIEEGKEFIYKNVSVGHHAFASTQRYFKGASPDKDMYEKIFRLELLNAIISVNVAENLLKIEKPDILVTSHGCYSSWGSFSDYFKKGGIKVCTYGRGYKRDTLRFDHNKLGESFEKYLEIIRNKKLLNEEEMRELRSFLNKRIKGQEGDTSLYSFSTSGKNIEKKFDLNTYNKTYALFPNVPWDASLVNANSAFKDVYEWISYTIDLFKEKPKLQLIIKIHPAEKTSDSLSTVEDYINSCFPSLPKNIKVVPPDTKISPYSLFSIIDVGIVYNGTIGLEMALQGLPVVVAGVAHYGKKKFTYDAATKKEYEEILFSNIPRLGKEKIQLAEMYAYFFFIKNFLPINYLYYNNFLNLGWNVKSINEFRKGKDKYLDIICNYITNGGIYQDW